MQPDPQPAGARQRMVRATGAAVGIGVALMENCIPNSGGRLMVFTGGPCTLGPGLVVGLQLEESIRTHRVCRKLYPSVSSLSLCKVAVMIIFATLHVAARSGVMSAAVYNHALGPADGICLTSLHCRAKQVKLLEAAGCSTTAEVCHCILLRLPGATAKQLLVCPARNAPATAMF